MIEPAGGAQGAPGVAVGLDERERPGNDRPQPSRTMVCPAQPVADPGLQPADDLDLHGIDEASPIAQVGVHQGPRHARRVGDLVEGDEQGIVLGEQPLGGVGDEAPAPATVTLVTTSPGSSGWWQAT
jgi:hypothetical protein